MPWSNIARGQCNRDHLRYPSDLTDPEWTLTAPLLPAAQLPGRPRTPQLRDVVG
ncbi:MAG: transposase, partial [Paracoccaceae bacterium]